MTTAADGGGARRMRFALGAVPLSRPDVSRFIRDWRVPARGAAIAVLEQRPPPDIRDRWLAQLAELAPDPTPATAQILATDDAMAHVGHTRTDRLVPRALLDDAQFLERNLGGWAPVWFDAFGVDGDPPVDDPVLTACERLVDYGPQIASRTAPRALVASRLDEEFVGGRDGLRRGAAALCRLRSDAEAQLVPRLAAATRGAGPLAAEVGPALAYDELIEQLYRLELDRRAAVAEDHEPVARRVADRQRRHAEQLGVELMLKGEYIAGRHRRSTILLAEGLGVVAKQPAPEPEHEVELHSRTYEGAGQHWPRVVGSGRMVTARAAIAGVVGLGAIERLNAVFGRDVWFSVALGLSVEPFESGPTLAALARRRPAELTADRYDEILVHQMVCEHLDVDNPDWHAANFMVTSAGLVHVDWGAARPIDPADVTPEGARQRLEQVAELAWSFQDQQLADRVRALHARAVGDRGHVARLRARARAMAGDA